MTESRTKNNNFTTLGASNHTNEDRQKDDFYATDPIAAKELLELETFSSNIWESACGEGHLSRVFEKAGYNVKSTDLIDRGFGKSGVDFLSIDNIKWNGDIITNPPNKHVQRFIEKALQIIPVGNKVAIFTRLLFLEGKGRKLLFQKHPPKTVYVSSSRIQCAKNAEFDKFKKGKSPMATIWIVWEKGFNGKTEIKWFN